MNSGGGGGGEWGVKLELGCDYPDRPNGGGGGFNKWHLLGEGAGFFHVVRGVNLPFPHCPCVVHMVDN